MTETAISELQASVCLLEKRMDALLKLMHICPKCNCTQMIVDNATEYTQTLYCPKCSAEKNNTRSIPIIYDIGEF